jgi:hypothetical protein
MAMIGAPKAMPVQGNSGCETDFQMLKNPGSAA